MRKVIFSLLTIIATVGVIGGAAYAYFSDRAVLAANTYATGVLEVRLNGQETANLSQSKIMEPLGLPVQALWTPRV